MGHLEDEMAEMLEQERQAGHVSGGNPDRIPGQNEDMAVDSQGYNPDPINRPMSARERINDGHFELVEAPCVFGPHLPGWPLVVYTGHQTGLHGVAKVVEAGIRWSRRKEAYVFELTLEFEATDGRTVNLPHVALGHVQPITPQRRV